MNSGGIGKNLNNNDSGGDDSECEDDDEEEDLDELDEENSAALGENLM